MRVLVLAPHTDDESIGPGGTIARMIGEGHDLFCVAFSPAVESLPKGVDKHATQREFAFATKELGISIRQVYLHEFPVRHFPEKRQEILEMMCRHQREIKPDLVLAPSTHHTHQDHEVISREANRAFQGSSVLGYESFRNNPRFAPQFFYTLKLDHIETKCAAVRKYKSQAWRMPRDSFELAGTIADLAVVRGAQVGRMWAEAYEVIRWII